MPETVAELPAAKESVPVTFVFVPIAVPPTALAVAVLPTAMVRVSLALVPLEPMAIPACPVTVVI